MKRIINPLPLGMVKSFLLQGNTNILVDAGLSKSPDKIRKELDRIGVKMESISLIIITHNHPDHIGGLTARKAVTLPFLLSNRKAILSSMKFLLDRGVKTFHTAHGVSCTADAVKKLVAKY